MPKTPDPAEVKKQLEALAGQELTPEQAISLTFPLGAHDTTDGIVASRLILPPRKTRPDPDPGPPYWTSARALDFRKLSEIGPSACWNQ